MNEIIRGMAKQAGFYLAPVDFYNAEVVKLEVFAGLLSEEILSAVVHAAMNNADYETAQRIVSEAKQLLKLDVVTS